MEQAGAELAPRWGCLAGFHSNFKQGARWPQADASRQELGSVHPKTMDFLHLPWARKDGKSWRWRERVVRERLLRASWVVGTASARARRVGKRGPPAGQLASLGVAPKLGEKRVKVGAPTP